MEGEVGGHSSRVQPGGEEELHISGYRASRPRLLATAVLTLLTGGLPLLLFRWRPNWRLALTCRPVPLARCDRVLVLHCGSQSVSLETVEEEEVGAETEVPAGFLVRGREGRGSTDRSQLLEEGRGARIRYFHCRHLRYVWSLVEGFQPLTGLGAGQSGSELLERQGGLDQLTARGLAQLHGSNSISVPVPSYLSLLLEEVLHPFYIFQLCSIVLWSLDEYVFYAVCIFTISLLSVAVSLHETRRQAEMLHSMVAQGAEGKVRVLRGREEVEVEAASLCPGEVLLLPAQGCLLPCDAVLLTGSAIVNEAMLTGESVPVTKVCLEEGEAGRELYTPDSHNRHTLFAGTEVIQTRYYGDRAVLALVTRTGFHTAKGELIRSIMFPKPMDFKFYRDSIRFIGCLFLVAACGMVYCIRMYIERGVGVKMILLRTLDIITIVVPPALPAAMTVGTVYAQARLRKDKIFCLSPARINVCGKLKLVCFDKTGTLTEEGLSLWGVLPCASLTLGPPVRHLPSLDRESMLVSCLAACHSLLNLEGRLSGDPLDLSMFEALGWELQEGAQETETYDQIMPTVVRPLAERDPFSEDHLPLEIGISRQFTFSSGLARMSVIAKKLHSPDFLVLCKGAPERVEELCLAASLPADYSSRLAELAMAGYRVVALAGRVLKANFLKVQRMTREEAERDLTFLGFLVMQNTLKPESPGVIAELRAASLRCLMLTGDNLLTAVSVARNCGLLSEGETVSVVSHTKDESGTYSLHFQDSIGGEGEPLSPAHTKHRLLAITGKTWAVALNHFPGLVPRLLLRTAVWARMSPDQKAAVVEATQQLGYVTAMCGDGANDCGALKAAHVGVSLSEAEASVAAPFTSAVPNISCIPSLMKEGRCALVTSFGVFKYMALYSMIQFSSVLILYSNKTNLGDTQFLYIDLVITTTVAVLMGRTGPCPGLAPQRPPGSLVTGTTLASIVLQVALSFGGQLGATLYLHSRPWWSPVEPSSPEEEIILNYDTTTVFIVSSYQYLSLATVFSSGRPYRKPFYTNLLFLAALLVLSTTTALLLADPLPQAAGFFQLMLPFPGQQGAPTFAWILVAIVIGNAVCNWGVEALLGWGRWMKNLSHVVTRKKGPRNKYKLVQRELEEEEREGGLWPRDQAVYHSQAYS